MSKAKSVLKVVVIVLSTALVIGLFSTFFAPKKEAEPSECAHENVRTLQGYVQSCEFPGLTEGKECADCGAILVAQYEIGMDEHNIVVSKEAVEPTCYSYGLTEEKSCSVCGKIMEEQRSTTKLPHPGQEAVDEVPATCSAVGYTAGSRCIICKSILTGCEEIPATEHNEEIPIAAIDPTCTSVGWTEGKKCSDCGTPTVVPTEIPKLEHNLYLADSTATCTTNGFDLYRCTECSYEERQYVNALGHSWRNLSKCSVCGELKFIDELQLVRGVQLNVVDEDRPQLDFKISVNEGYIETLLDNQEVGAWVMEYEKANAVVLKTDYTEWVNEVEGSFVAANEEYTRVAVKNIPYKKINTQYVVVPVVKTTFENGNVIYQYASNSYKDGVKDGVNAWSVAYMASLALHYAEDGDERINALKKYIDESADLARGLSAPVYDGTTYKITGYTKIDTYSYRLIFENDVYNGIYIVKSGNKNCSYSNGVLTFDEGTTGTQQVTLSIAGNAYVMTVTID